MSVKIYTAFRTKRDADLFPTLWALKARAQSEARVRLGAVYRDILEDRSAALAEWYATADKEITGMGLAEMSEVLGAEVKDHAFGVRMVTQAVLVGEHKLAAGPRPKSSIAVRPEKILWDLHHGAGIERVDTATAKRDLSIDPLDTFDIDQWVRHKYAAQLGSAHRNTWNLDVSMHVRVDDRGRGYLIPDCDGASLLRGTLDVLADAPELESFAYWNNTDRPKDVHPAAWDFRRRKWDELAGEADSTWSNYFVVEVVRLQQLHMVLPTVELSPP